MERTVTIPLSEYEHLKRVNEELHVEVRRANEAAGKWLDKLGEVAQVVAFLTSDDDEDESDDGSEPEPTLGTIPDSMSWKSWTCAVPLAGSGCTSPHLGEYVVLDFGGMH